MKKIACLLFLLAIACSQDVEDKLAHLNGYWQIQSVELPDGTQKQFSISQNVDFIEISEGIGIRKKVQPDALGNFKADESTEKIVVQATQDTLTLHYSTPFANWKEVILSATQDKLIAKNEDGRIFTYSRYEPLITE